MTAQPRDGFAAAATKPRQSVRKPRHQSATRAFACWLAIGPDSDRLGDLASVLEARLTRDEQASILSAAIAAADPADAVALLRAALSDLDVGAGEPLPPWRDLPDEARHWAALASPAELRAYAAAAFAALPARDRAAFLKAAERRHERI